MRTKLDSSFRELAAYLSKVEAQFLTTEVCDSLCEPATYALPVKAYFTLSHAAFEQFFEDATGTVLDHAVDQYVNHKTVNTTIVALLCYYQKRIVHIDEESESQEIIYDQVRKLLGDCKTELSKLIYKKNHGASLKYLRSMLTPLAIDIPSDARFMDALTKLANARGDYAHRHSSRQSNISPEDAKKIVEDCKLLAEEILQIIYRQFGV